VCSAKGRIVLQAELTKGGRSIGVLLPACQLLTHHMSRSDDLSERELPSAAKHILLSTATRCNLSHTLRKV